MKKSLIILLLMLITLTSFAHTFYKGKDASGKIIYSDQPLENGQPVEIKETPTYSTPPISTTSEKTTSAQSTSKVKEYQISIVQPQNEQTFTTDIETIEVKLSITPELDKTDKIRLYLNGQPSKELYSSPAITLARLDRGSYQLKAEVINENSPTIVKGKSSVVTFFQKRTTINRPGT